jgi:hypothetical protein
VLKLLSRRNFLPVGLCRKTIPVSRERSLKNTSFPLLSQAKRERSFEQKANKNTTKIDNYLLSLYFFPLLSRGGGGVFLILACSGLFNMR